MLTKKKYTVISLLIIILLIVSAANAQIVDRYGTTVLCMYKSSDKYTENNNPIKQFFEKHLASFGLKTQYHDFDRGFPDVDDLKDVRAVLTWYNGAVVEKKKIGIKYAEFLNECLDKGLKVIVVNSFGAYGYKYRGKAKWDLVNYINPLFKRMGFNFKGFWTNKAVNLKIIAKDSTMVERGAKQDVKLSMHYQQLVPVRSDVITYLKLKRTDHVEGLGDGVSSVILTSRTGGFALENYAFRFKDAKLLLNPYLFLKNSLFHDDNYQNIGLVIGDVKNRKKVLTDLSYACRYAKIESSLIDIKKMKSMIGQDLAQYEAVLIATNSIEGIPARTLRQYTEMGGSVVFIRNVKMDNEYQKLLGVTSYNESDNYTEEGFITSKDFFINGFPINGKNVGINMQKCKVSGVRLAAYANNYEKDPIAWVKNIGKGKILYWNTDFLLKGVKGFRGSIIQSIHYIREGFITSMANIGMMMIDDYPQPWWNLNYRENRLEYYNDLLANEGDEDKKRQYRTLIERLKKYPNITDTTFISSTWFRDMKLFTKKFNIPYSTFLIFNYNKQVGKKEKNFAIRDFYLSEGGLSQRMGNMILDQGWELGLHGYNHQSLTMTKPEAYDSRPWPGPEIMVKALSTARKEWIKLYGRYALPFSYVAPHNVIDREGIASLGKVFPSIRALCTIYGGQQGEADHEFEWSEGGRFFKIPRASSGYVMESPLDRYYMYDLIWNFGVISHFIHPDDVFDVSRSNNFKGWNYMKRGFFKEFKNIKKAFPFIRWMTVRDAYSEFIFYTNTNIRVKRNGSVLTIVSNDGSSRDLYLRLRLPGKRKIVKMVNCKKVSKNNKTGDIIIKTNSSMSRIILR